MFFIRIIVLLWIAFYSFWLISAIGVKKSVRGTSWRRGIAIRLLLVFLVIAFVRLLRIQNIWVPTRSIPIGIAGLAVCVAGLGLAVWARRYLGRNWGTPMSLKEGHELVTTGPYRVIRHPIYTGILTAMLGSSLVAGRFWVVLFVVIMPFFVYSAKTEDGLMMQEFPERYPEYRKRTHALIPFVW
jgi:protein-S-isoprenylcysteine O-methyltransferase Ste14